MNGNDDDVSEPEDTPGLASAEGQEVAAAAAAVAAENGAEFSVDHLCDVPEHDVSMTANFEGKVNRGRRNKLDWKFEVEGGVIECHREVYVLNKCLCLLTR